MCWIFRLFCSSALQLCCLVCAVCLFRAVSQAPALSRTLLRFKQEGTNKRTSSDQREQASVSNPLLPFTSLLQFPLCSFARPQYFSQ
ncbi:hypothetical protein B0T09DRAFT_330120 [Sordaria sp. MPI-SDFR-AT-0083]|nr:hypothetical protein B0T09DRAFT_330120 [Sordaria sp. MPI-SDFR-AT-0083]